MALKPFPILFIGPSRIGDAVLASGLIKKLADEAPGARFTIVVGPAAAPLFTKVPGLDALIVMEKMKGSGHWIALWSKVRGQHWSLVVDMRGSAIAGFLRRDRRAVHRKSQGEPVHKVIEAARLLTLEDDPPAPFLYTSEEIEARAAELVGEGGPILAMGPAANWLGKTWPIERFARVAIELLDADGPMAGGRLMILGGPDDARYVEPLARTLPRDRLIDLTGQVDLLTAYAALKRARLFVGNDSGLMHLAAAAGAPTIGLFGPSDDRLYAPWGPDTRVVRGPREFEQFKAVDPGLNQTIGHMMDLPVDTVVEAARELLTATE
jgi:ADP-heptose:LPS heptosyltransferase